MGEYAKHNGHEIKIGTCESMYYLRADQARAVQPLPGSVDPVKHAAEIRFRFPFPDEDTISPGAFADHDRGVVVMVAQDPEGHSSPCTGSQGASIVQQRLIGASLVLVAECPECGWRYRLPTIEDAQPYATACKEEATREPSRAAFWLEMARRIVAGYTDPNPWSRTTAPAPAPATVPHLSIVRDTPAPAPFYCGPSYERRKGDKYEATKDLRDTEIAKLIRADIKAAVAAGELPRWKYGVRTRGSSMHSAIDVLATLPAGMKQGAYQDHGHGRFEWTPEVKAAQGKIEAIRWAYNYDGSDSASDYFDVRFYGSVSFEETKEAPAALAPAPVVAPAVRAPATLTVPPPFEMKPANA